ncbi:hypothetical protein [Brevundimonas naejangsanensis]|uniref:hypothetical protein n=1 Tax=Brevundimonas naejangsanensis TaxID=588932 RepID=UPI00320A1D45
MTTPRFTVPPHALEAIAFNLCSLHDFDVRFVQENERFASAVITEYVRTLSAAPAPEGGAVDWSYDLTSCPRSEPFLIAYADGDVRMGHYLDNSKSSVPWEGIRPLFGAERWDAKIVAWAKRPALATRETAPAEAGEQWLWRIPGRGWVLCDKEGDVVREVSIDGAWIETEVVALSALRAQPQARSGDGK